MNDLTHVLELEAVEAEMRFAALDFAGERGRSIARTVKKRRVTRAVSTGGVSVAAVGGFVFAGLHGPDDSLKAQPGSPCASPTPLEATPSEVSVYRLAADAAPAVTQGGVVIGVGDNDASVVALEVPEASGDVIATYEDGSSRAFPADEGGTVVVEGDETGTQLVVRVSIAAESGQVDLTVSQVESVTWSATATEGADAPGVIDQDGHCVPRPSPSAERDDNPAPTAAAPSDSDVTGTVDEEAWIDLPTSPFECDFELGEPMSGTELVSVVPPRYADADSQKGKTTVYASMGLGADLPTEPVVFATGLDPATVTTPDRLEDWRSLTFVAVRDGKVSGTLYATSLVRSRVGTIGGGASVTTDLTRLPLAMCPGAQVEREYHVYAVAGQMIIGPDGIVEGPTYAWMDLGTPQLDRGYEAPLGEE